VTVFSVPLLETFHLTKNHPKPTYFDHRTTKLLLIFTTTTTTTNSSTDPFLFHSKGKRGKEEGPGEGGGSLEELGKGPGGADLQRCWGCPEQSYQGRI
jgi:hypothetical protein